MSDDIEYLKEEKDKAWARIVTIEEEINLLRKSLPENIQDIKNDSRNASRYRNRCEESAKKAQEYENYIENIHSDMKTKQVLADDINTNLQNYQQSGKIYLDSLSLQVDEINDKYKTIKETISEIEDIYENNENLS